MSELASSAAFMMQTNLILAQKEALTKAGRLQIYDIISSAGMRL
jgi:hypothetical protein